MKKINILLFPTILCLGAYTFSLNVFTEVKADVSDNAPSDSQPSFSPTQASAQPFSLQESSLASVAIPDLVLKQAILTQLGKPLTNELTKEDMEHLTSLRLLGETAAQIHTLTGLEYAANLVDITLDASQVTDFSPLEQLSSLVYVSLSGKNITSANFPNLSKSSGITHIYASNAQLDNDVLPKLVLLKQLERLYLDSNIYITTLEPLKILPKLRSISVQFCGITDFTVISEFPALNDLAAFGQNTGRTSTPTTITRTNLPYDAEQETIFLPFTLMPDRLTNFDGYVPPFTISTSANETQLEFNGVRLPENRLQINEHGITVSAVSEEEYSNLSSIEYNARINNPVGNYQTPANFAFYSISSGTYLHQFDVVDEPKDGAPVAVRYLDETGLDIEEPTILTGKIDEAFQTAPKEFNGWILKTSPDNNQGNFTLSPQEIIYLYEKAQGAPIIVKYLDETGQQLQEPTVLTGTIDTPFQTTPKEMDDWTLKTSPNNEHGTFTLNTQEVVYIYEKALGAPITIHYLDETGRKLANSEVLTGQLGISFETNDKQINGWQLKQAPLNKSGRFTKQRQTIQYIYNKQTFLPNDLPLPLTESFNSEPLFTNNTLAQTLTISNSEPAIHTLLPNTSSLKKEGTSSQTTHKKTARMGTVTVKFVDKNGTEITNPQTLTGEVGKQYKVTAKNKIEKNK